MHHRHLLFETKLSNIKRLATKKEITDYNLEHEEISARLTHGDDYSDISKDRSYKWQGFSKVQKMEENVLPRPYPKVRCLECGQEVCDNINYKIGHLYNKHNCKPSVDDVIARKMLKQYFI